MWNWIKKSVLKQTNNAVSLDSADFLKMLGIDISEVDKNKLSEITYFTCLRILSENVGSTLR